MTDQNSEPVGYGRPPSGTKFRKGQSGNPKGRPRNRSRELPYNSVLGQMVTIREDGRERRVTAAEAFLLQLTQKGLAGDSAAARATLGAIESARSKEMPGNPINELMLSLIGQGIETIIGELGIATKKYPEDEKRVRWELQPWIVQAALARLGERQLTPDEQREVWRNTRTPHKVEWPDWWSVHG